MMALRLVVECRLDLSVSQRRPALEVDIHKALLGKQIQNRAC